MWKKNACFLCSVVRSQVVSSNALHTTRPQYGFMEFFDVKDNWGAKHVKVGKINFIVIFDSCQNSVEWWNYFEFDVLWWRRLIFLNLDQNVSRLLLECFLAKNFMNIHPLSWVEYDNLVNINKQTNKQTHQQNENISFLME